MERPLKKGLMGHDVAFRPFPGARIEGLIDKVSSVEKPFDWILVHVGTNNITCDAVGTIIRKFGFLIEKIASCNPSAKVVVSGILPRSANLYQIPRQQVWIDDVHINDVNQKIQEVNSSLSWMCGVKNTHFYLSPQPLLAQDGLHLSQSGSPRLAMEFVAVLFKLMAAQHDSLVPPMTCSTAAFPPITSTVKHSPGK